ncbi:hypothetical protein FA15DRAFT_747845 [Coprinopsis marcescibilis]|uniref:Uncharacterized protein n=1 Tax=Coprinopsis marcescibilis TaxID=230819 RepID=A0A5C3L787_COPMA|nr:hypothetical protein FA15DRAFT_747845 [Coprinopsis marcescibilis]
MFERFPRIVPRCKARPLDSVPPLTGFEFGVGDSLHCPSDHPDRANFAIGCGLGRTALIGFLRQGGIRWSYNIQGQPHISAGFCKRNTKRCQADNRWCNKTLNANYISTYAILSDGCVPMRVVQYVPGLERRMVRSGEQDPGGGSEVMFWPVGLELGQAPPHSATGAWRAYSAQQRLTGSVTAKTSGKPLGPFESRQKRSKEEERSHSDGRTRLKASVPMTDD